MEKFLVIASDGLWGVMRVEEVVKFVHNFDKDDICNLGDVSHRYALANQALSTCFSTLGEEKYFALPQKVEIREMLLFCTQIIKMLDK